MHFNFSHWYYILLHTLYDSNYWSCKFLRDLCSELADDVDDGSDLPLLESMTQLLRNIAVLKIRVGEAIS